MENNMINKTQTKEYQIYFKNPLREITRFGDDLQSWYELIDILENVSFETENGPVQININWGNAKSYLSDSISRYIDLSHHYTKDEFDELVHTFDEYMKGIKSGIIPEGFEIICKVTSSEEKTSDEYIVYLLNLIFLTLNLSSPGSCNLTGLSISPHNVMTEIFEKYYIMSAGKFEGAVELYQRMGWPQLDILPANMVWKWLLYQSQVNEQSPNRNIQKVLYSLMNLCNEITIFSPISLIWLAYSLESIFDTPELGINKKLRDRVFLIHGKPKAFVNDIRKKMTNFYEMRSAFVHGKAEIPNSLFAMRIDTNQYLDKLNESIEFATLLVLSSIQKLIINNWSGFDFIETFSGRK
jgi:hypothetical protein